MPAESKTFHERQSPLQSNRLVWVLEDNADCQFIYEQSLNQRYRLRIIDSIAGLVRALREPGVEPPIVVVADLRLADGNFLDFLCGEKGGLFGGLPFIVISDIDDLDVMRACFERGALDYLTKPFTRSELIVKLERLHEKQRSSGEIVLDLERLRVSRDDASARLTAKELQIFTRLHRAAGKPVAREQIEREVWVGARVGAKSLDVHLFNMRRKLAALGMSIRYTPPSSYVLVISERAAHAGERGLLGAAESLRLSAIDPGA